MSKHILRVFTIQFEFGLVVLACLQACRVESLGVPSTSTDDEVHRLLTVLEASSDMNQVYSASEKVQGFRPEILQRARSLLLKRSQCSDDREKSAEYRRALLRTYMITVHPDWTVQRVFTELSSLAALRLVVDPEDEGFRKEFQNASEIPQMAGVSGDKLLRLLESLSITKPWAFSSWISGEDLVVVRRDCRLR